MGVDFCDVTYNMYTAIPPFDFEKDLSILSSKHAHTHIHKNINTNINININSSLLSHKTKHKISYFDLIFIK